MSTSVVTPTIVARTIDQRTITYFGTLAVGAGTYTAGGLTLNFAGLVQAPSIPLEVRIYSKASPVSGYSYQFAYGTTQANGLVQVLECAGSAAPFAEIAASTTPSGVTGDTIGFTAVFQR